MSLSSVAFEKTEQRQKLRLATHLTPENEGLKPSQILGLETVHALAYQEDGYASRARFLHLTRAKLTMAEVHHLASLRYEADPGFAHWGDELRRYRAINRRVLADLYNQGIDGILQKAVIMNKIDLSTENLERVRAYIKEEAPQVKLKGYVSISEYTEALINEVLELRKQKAEPERT